MFSKLVSVSFLSLLLSGTMKKAIAVSVSSTVHHAILTTLEGQIYEDIDSREGGPYHKLLVSRAFKQATRGNVGEYNGWPAVKRATLNVIRPSTPVLDALPSALQVAIPSGRSGAVGFANGGYYDIKVQAGLVYIASFYYRFPSSSDYSGNATVSLQTTGGQILGSVNATISGSQTSWKQIIVKITPSISASNLSNNFVITIDGFAGVQTIQFAMLSLLSPTKVANSGAASTALTFTLPSNSA